MDEQGIDNENLLWVGVERTNDRANEGLCRIHAVQSDVEIWVEGKNDSELLRCKE